MRGAQGDTGKPVSYEQGDGVFYFSRGEQAALIILLALLLTGGGLLLYTKGQQAAGPAAEPLLEEARSPATVAVQVSGEVRRPGLYQLTKGARVADAVSAAGGATERADLGQLDLAARVHDGAKVEIAAVASSAGSSSAAPAAPARGKPAAPGLRGERAGAKARLSLNSATAAELDQLPGIGPVLAKRIIDYRERLKRSTGRGFTGVEELLDVPGIGPKRFADLRPLVSP
jgi:competence protein ComEA